MGTEGTGPLTRELYVFWTVMEAARLTHSLAHSLVDDARKSPGAAQGAAGVHQAWQAGRQGQARANTGAGEVK